MIIWTSWKSYSFHNTSWARQFHTASQLQGGGNTGNEWKQIVTDIVCLFVRTRSLQYIWQFVFIISLTFITFYFRLGYPACRSATIARPFDSIYHFNFIGNSHVTRLDKCGKKRKKPDTTNVGTATKHRNLIWRWSSFVCGMLLRHLHRHCSAAADVACEQNTLANCSSVTIIYRHIEWHFCLRPQLLLSLLFASGCLLATIARHRIRAT